MVSWRSGLLVIAIAAVAACDTAVEAEEEPDIDGGLSFIEGRDCPPDSFLDYTNFGEPFFRTWCTGCHSADLPEGARQTAPIDVNFDTTEDITARLEQVYGRAGDGNTTMPPAGGPGEEERLLLGEWLACGAR